MTMKKLPLIDKEMIVPFWLLTSCFIVWGLAQDLTAPLVTAFKGIFTMSTFEASLVQFAYFGAYFCLALPTAFLNERFGYKVGVLTGLGLAAIGAFGFYPAAKSLTFGFFLIALFILAAGLSVLETSANPFAIAMGPEGTATRRLNLAQSFNPLGTNLGVLLAAVLVLPKMNPATPEQRATMPHDQLVAIQTGELNAIMNPYLGLAVALVIIWIGLFIKKVPRSHEEVASDSHHLHFGDTVRRLHHNHHWRYGVLAQFFNVGAQVCTWTYIVLYVAEVVPGGTAVRGAYFLQVSLILFFISRFVMTWLMGYFRATKLLAIMASIAILLCSLRRVLPRPVRGVGARRGVRLPVVDVPHDLRGGAARSRGGHQIRSRRPGHGDSRRRHYAANPGPAGRPVRYRAGLRRGRSLLPGRIGLRNL